MAMFRPLVEESEAVDKNVARWQGRIESAATATERMATALEKGSRTPAPAGPSPWWSGSGGPGLVNSAGQPISSGASGSSGDGSSGRGQGLQRVPAMRTVYTPGFGLSMRYDDPSKPDTPGDYLGEVRGDWRWERSPNGYFDWVRMGRTISGGTTGSGQGPGASASSAYQGPHSNIYDPNRAFIDPASGRNIGHGALDGKASVEVTGQAAQNLATMAAGINELVINDRLRQRPGTMQRTQR